MSDDFIQIQCLQVWFLCHYNSSFFADKDHNGNILLKKQKLTERFKVELPEDFFDFWEFCKKLNLENPCGKNICV